MTAMMIHAARLLLAAPLMAAASPVLAGQFQMMPAPTPEADALAADMRILGNNPFDLPALIRAGERTLKLGDMEAAAAFFQRAERISPNNGQIKAGKARTLVQLGRPGEALRLFNEAEALGYDLTSIAADRGLAFDLIGEQERAQRIYRQALKRQSDDETQRRYALSLGISGKRDMALEVIDALLRRSDRAAWRVRAVVLAMNGDVAGAGKIADNMLPREMATGLQPFFQILPGLGAADRAFAVHFGEVRATPERIADARMIPVLPALIPEPVAVVQVAAVPARTPAQQRRDRNRRRGAPVEVAAMVAPPIPVPTQLPPPPRVVMAAPIPQSTPTPMPAPARTSTPPVVASAAVIAPPAARLPIANPPATALRLPPAAPLAAPPVVAAASPMPGKTEATPPVTVAALSLPRPVSGPLIDQPAIAAPVQPSLTRPAPEAARGDIIVNDPVVTATASNTPAPAESAPPPATPAPEPVPVLVSAPAPAKTQVKPVASEESILARIIATIGVPDSELAGAPAAAAVAGRAATEIDPNKPPLLDKKALEKKALADKAAAQKKLADKKLADEKLAKLKAEKADPSRIWVQVAGGSSVRDLPKEWARLRDKAPAAFKARSAYTTPLRFTNRLLAGPFKSDDDAQSFVNQIAKSGLTGFVFTSEAGQKIAKLPAK